MDNDDTGRLLALLHDADLTFARFVGEYRDWVRPAPSSQLTVAVSENGTPRVHWRGPGPNPPAWTVQRRIWFERPDRMRVELIDGTELFRLAIRDESHWWQWDHRQGVATGVIRSRADELSVPAILNPPVLAPAGLIARFHLEPAGTSVRLRRNVVISHARLRRARSDEVDQRFEFEFDADVGIVLRRAKFQGGICVASTEATMVSVEPDGIAPERFVFEPPRVGATAQRGGAGFARDEVCATRRGL